MHYLTSQMNGSSSFQRHAFLLPTSALSIAIFRDLDTALWDHLMNLDPMEEDATMEIWHLRSTSLIGVKGLSGLRLIDNLQLRLLKILPTTPSSENSAHHHVTWMSTISKQCLALKPRNFWQIGALLMWTGQEVVLTRQHLGRQISVRISSRRFLEVKHAFTMTKKLQFVSSLPESLLQALCLLY